MIDFAFCSVRLLTVPVLELQLVNSLAHAQDVSRSANDVASHPKVSSGERSNIVGISITGHGTLNISPSGDHGAQYHKEEGRQRYRSDLAAKDPDLSICNGNDGQVLEDGIDWHGQILQ